MHGTSMVPIQGCFFLLLSFHHVPRATPLLTHDTYILFFSWLVVIVKLAPICCTALQDVVPHHFVDELARQL